MHGEVDVDKITEATIKFMKKAELNRKHKLKEMYDGNKTKTRAVIEK